MFIMWDQFAGSFRYRLVIKLCDAVFVYTDLFADRKSATFMLMSPAADFRSAIQHVDFLHFLNILVLHLVFI